ncbi:cytochrome P450 [Suillus decipiens]|nr:cytochrome P450 [Suillus decipiens]
MDHPWLMYSKWEAEYGEIIYSRLFSQDIVVINSERVVHDLLDHHSHNYSTRPSGIVRMLDFFSTAVVMSIVYDYTAVRLNDPVVVVLERSLEVSIKEIRPYVAALLEELLILEKLPPWFPGVSIVKGAMLNRSLVPMIRDLPFEHVAGTAGPSMVSDALCRIPDKAKHEEVAALEKAIKEAGASGYAAGSETICLCAQTTSTLYVFLLAMVLYPEVQACAQAEIDGVIREALRRLPDWNDHAFMPYVNAIIQEMLRWFPVAPLGIPHATVNDNIYKGHYIPKGATVMANTWSMACNLEKYPNLMKFIPEHHMSKITTEAEELSAHHGRDDISFAFGFGRHACVGRHVVNDSLFAAVVNVLAIFRLEHTPGWNIGPDAEGVPWMRGLATHVLTVGQHSISITCSIFLASWNYTSGKCEIHAVAMQQHSLDKDNLSPAAKQKKCLCSLSPEIGEKTPEAKSILQAQMQTHLADTLGRNPCNSQIFMPKVLQF